MRGSERIEAAVAALRAGRPAYGPILDFYGKLLLAQEKTKGRVDIQPLEISQRLFATKRGEGLPLINERDFTVDVKASEALLEEIGRLAVESNEVLAGAATKLVASIHNKIVDASTLFSKLLKGDKSYFETLAQQLDIDEKLLLCLVYNSIRPSLAACAEKLAIYLDRATTWERGYCPICGCPPGLSLLRTEGERSLVCGFCGHEWQARRMCCPFCDNHDLATLHYFFTQQEKAYRVDVCEKCGKYVKTVDARKMQGPLNPFLEQISTLHLDILAQQRGLESAIPLWLQT